MLGAERGDRGAADWQSKRGRGGGYGIHGGGPLGAGGGEETGACARRQDRDYIMYGDRAKLLGA